MQGCIFVKIYFESLFLTHTFFYFGHTTWRLWQLAKYMSWILPHSGQKGLMFQFSLSRLCAHLLCIRPVDAGSDCFLFILIRRSTHIHSTDAVSLSLVCVNWHHKKNKLICCHTFVGVCYSLLWKWIFLTTALSQSRERQNKGKQAITWKIKLLWEQRILGLQTCSVSHRSIFNGQ